MLYVNFDDERLQPLTGGDLHRVVDAYYRLYPERRAATAHLFFDEIQNIPGWEPFVRRLLDTEQVQVCLTGSSAKLLSREIATSLRGRSLSTEIFPFSFAEALAHQGVAPPTAGRRPGAKARSLLENRLRSYLFTGGFPEVQGIEAPLRIRILQEYVDVVILRDVAERHAVANLPPLRALIRHHGRAPPRPRHPRHPQRGGAGEHRCGHHRHRPRLAMVPHPGRRVRVGGYGRSRLLPAKPAPS